MLYKFRDTVTEEVIIITADSAKLAVEDALKLSPNFQIQLEFKEN